MIVENESWFRTPTMYVWQIFDIEKMESKFEKSASFPLK